jgi:hypothetical protein
LTGTLGVGKPKKYFDDALAVLRENGQHETVLYVRTLVGITSRLTQAGALEGALSADTAGLGLTNPGGAGLETLINSGLSSVTHDYQSGYRVLAGYMREAVELVEVLGIEDPYLSAKVAIVQAKTKVLETLYLEVVPPSIRGSVPGRCGKNINRRTTISHPQSTFSWRMPNRTRTFWISPTATVWILRGLARIWKGWLVFARIIPSIWPPDIRPTGCTRSKPGETFRKPQFVPVCINGRLMAVLINSPKVSIEEID